MKTFKIVICIVMVCVFLSACDWGLRVVGIEMNTYPDKLFYVIGIDTEVDVYGGSVTFINLENRNRDRSGERGYPMSRLLGRICARDVDLNVEGIYSVNIFWPPDFTTSFNVQVISIETLKYRVGLI